MTNTPGGKAVQRPMQTTPEDEQKFADTVTRMNLNEESL